MHDVIIIGAGPAGMSAALWCDELGLDTLVLEAARRSAGNSFRFITPSEIISARGRLTGRDLCELFAAQIADAEFDLWTETEIESVDLRRKRVALASGEKVQVDVIIIATGVRRRRLGIPGEAELAGRGVLESATRDRDLFAGRDVCVVGGGDAAVENALLLAEVCPTVTLVHRGKKSERAQRVCRTPAGRALHHRVQGIDAATHHRR